jgi:hypothetical protein
VDENMHKKQLKKITINKVAFFIDYRYELVMSLISPEFEKQSLLIDQLFEQDMDTALKYADEVLKKGCSHDVAMIYFLSMLLQNCGNFKKAGTILTQLHKNHPTDLLAKCAYANHLMFHGRFDELPALFADTFDLAKLTTERELPLVTFAQCMSIACQYHMFKRDIPNFKKFLSYLMKGAPEHSETRRLVGCILQSDPKA